MGVLFSFFLFSFLRVSRGTVAPGSCLTPDRFAIAKTDRYMVNIYLQLHAALQGQRVDLTYLHITHRFKVPNVLLKGTTNFNWNKRAFPIIPISKRCVCNNEIRPLYNVKYEARESWMDVPSRVRVNAYVLNLQTAWNASEKFLLCLIVARLLVE